MKTKWHKRFDAESDRRKALQQELNHTETEFKRLAESYREQISNLQSVYHELRERYDEDVHDGWVEALRDEQVRSLQESNERMSDRLGRILGIVLNGEDPDEVDSDPA